MSVITTAGWPLYKDFMNNIGWGQVHNRCVTIKNESVVKSIEGTSRWSMKPMKNPRHSSPKNQLTVCQLFCGHFIHYNDKGLKGWVPLFQGYFNTILASSVPCEKTQPRVFNIFRHAFISSVDANMSFSQIKQVYLLSLQYFVLWNSLFVFLQTVSLQLQCRDSSLTKSDGVAAPHNYFKAHMSMWVFLYDWFNRCKTNLSDRSCISTISNLLKIHS